MKLIEPSVEIIKQEPGINGMMKMIELAGRTAYKSEDHITEDSAKKFVKMLKQRDHGAALEHGTVYLAIPSDCIGLYSFYILFYTHNPTFYIFF